MNQTLDLVLPSPCLACSRQSTNPQRAFGLCQACRQRLEPWPAGCPTCGRRGPKEICSRCREKPPAYTRLLSGWTYRSPLDRVLTGLKFEGLDYLGAQLGRALAEMLGAALADCDLICPVPLHWTRRWRRGYDQALEIARAVARYRERPVKTVLRRRRLTAAQSSLGRRARLNNLQHAFVARRPAECRGRRILLVDDVYTTGTTLQAATAALQAAGASEIHGLTVARTPLDRNRPDKQGSSPGVATARARPILENSGSSRQYTD